MIDQVAEAICAAEGYERWPVLAEPGRDHYRRMAKAAIDAMGFHQEWGLSEGQRVHAVSADRDEVRAVEHDDEHVCSELVERDVLPWQPDRWRARSRPTSAKETT
jgi:hypothetical protein